MSSAALIERKLKVYNLSDLPFNHTTENIGLIDVSKVGVVIEGRSYPVDIGRFAFTKRAIASTNSSHRTINNYLVDPSTFRKKRTYALNSLLEHLYVSRKAKGTGGKSLHEQLNGLFRFIDWCDDKGHYLALESSDKAKAALAEYTDDLQAQIRLNKLSLNTASRYQRIPSLFLSELFESPTVDAFTSGIRRLRRKYNASNVTEAPSDERVGRVVALCEALFDHLCSFILDGADFPSKLSLPTEELWMLPTNIWVAPKKRLAKRSQWSRPAWAWNYSEGRINEPDEILGESATYTEADSGSKTKAKSMIRVATKRLVEANSNKRDQLRIRLAQWAHDSFLLLFIASTGTNLEQAVELAVPSDTLELEKKMQGFKTAKNRSGGKEVEYHIEARMVSRYRKFLQLRKYLVESSNDYKYMFTSLSDTFPHKPQKLRAGAIGQFFVKVKSTFGIDGISVTPRELRAYKSDYIINNYDPATAAMVMQNSEDTILKHYSNGNEKKTSEEFTRFTLILTILLSLPARLTIKSLSNLQLVNAQNMVLQARLMKEPL